VLPTHRLVATRDGHEVYQRQPGFEFTPMLLGRIASFLVRWGDDGLAVYAFMVPLLEAGAVDEERLLGEARRLIERRIAAGGPGDREERTFEYRGDRYVEVAEPRWWIGTWPTEPTRSRGVADAGLREG